MAKTHMVTPISRCIPGTRIVGQQTAAAVRSKQVWRAGESGTCGDQGGPCAPFDGVGGMKILATAYACRPDSGSEEGNGWHPLVCLDIDGPALQVTPQIGIKIPVGDPGSVVSLMAQALATLAKDPRLAADLGAAGRKRVGENFTWDRLGDRLAAMAPYASH